MFGEDRKMVRLAEESGEISRKGVGERFPLLVVALFPQQLQIVGETTQAQCAQPSREPAIDHIPFRGTECDARAIVDQGSDLLEVGLGEDELPVGTISSSGSGCGRISHSPATAFRGTSPIAASRRRVLPSTSILNTATACPRLCACSSSDSAAAAAFSTSAAFCCVVSSIWLTARLTCSMPEVCSSDAALISLMMSVTRLTA